MAGGQLSLFGRSKYSWVQHRGAFFLQLRSEGGSGYAYLQLRPCNNDATPGNSGATGGNNGATAGNSGATGGSSAATAGNSAGGGSSDASSTDAGASNATRGFSLPTRGVGSVGSMDEAPLAASGVGDAKKKGGRANPNRTGVWELGYLIERGFSTEVWDPSAWRWMGGLNLLVLGTVQEQGLKAVQAFESVLPKMEPPPGLETYFKVGPRGPGGGQGREAKGVGIQEVEGQGGGSRGWG